MINDLQAVDQKGLFRYPGMHIGDLRVGSPGNELNKVGFICIAAGQARFENLKIFVDISFACKKRIGDI